MLDEKEDNCHRVAVQKVGMLGGGGGGKEIEDSLTLPSTYRDLATARNLNLKETENESELLEAVLKKSNADIITVRIAHQAWLNKYEQFLQSNNRYQCTLSPEAMKLDQQELKNKVKKFECLINETWAWFRMNQTEDMRSTTSRSSRSSSASHISSTKLQEGTRMAELLARQAALKDEHRLAEEKFKLKCREEELKIKTELEVSNAKTKVLEELERSMYDNDESEIKLKYNQKQPVIRDNRTNSAQDFCMLGLLELTKELNKPNVEIVKFQGNPIDYNRFIRQFETKVVKNTDSYDEKMNLFQFTTGEANEIATGYSHLNAEIGFKATLKEFKERYGDPDVVANSYVKRALDWPFIKGDDPKALDAYNIFLVECQYVVENVSAARVLDYQENIQKIVKKLPYTLQERFRNIVFYLKESGKQVIFEELVKFIRKESKKANDPIFGKSVFTKQSHGGRNGPSQGIRKSFGTSIETGSISNSTVPK